RLRVADHRGHDRALGEAHELKPGAGLLDDDVAVRHVHVPADPVRTTLAGRNDRRVVQELQVREVDTVLAQFLDKGVDRPLTALGRDVVRIVEFRYLWHLPQRGHALRVVPGPDDAVVLGDRQRFEDRLALGDRRHDLRVGDAGAEPLGVVGPVVERAAPRAALALAAMSQLRAQVRTVGVHAPGLAGLGAKQHPLLAEALDVAQFARLQILAVADPEPAVRHRQRAALEAVTGGQRGTLSGDLFHDTAHRLAPWES